MMINRLVVWLNFPSGLAVAGLLLIALLTGPRILKFRARVKIHRIVACTIIGVGALHVLVTLYTKFFLN